MKTVYSTIIFLDDNTLEEKCIKYGIKYQLVGVTLG